MLAFSTASSEAAYPRLTEKLEAFGVDKKVVALTLPLGYAFNLDGSMMYQAFCSHLHRAGFWHRHAGGYANPDVARAYGQQQRDGRRSRGVSVVVVAAVAPMFHLPPFGVVLILAIDQVLDMGRTATKRL